jgi:hypothetical protein
VPFQFHTEFIPSNALSLDNFLHNMTAEVVKVIRDQLIIDMHRFCADGALFGETSFKQAFDFVMA